MLRPDAVQLRGRDGWERSSGFHALICQDRKQAGHEGVERSVLDPEAVTDPGAKLYCIAARAYVNLNSCRELCLLPAGRPTADAAFFRLPLCERLLPADAPCDHDAVASSRSRVLGLM